MTSVEDADVEVAAAQKPIVVAEKATMARLIMFFFIVLNPDPCRVQILVLFVMPFMKR